MAFELGSWATIASSFPCPKIRTWGTPFRFISQRGTWAIRQIWIAVSAYVLVAIVRKRLELEASLYQILQVLSLTLSEKTPILRALQQIDSRNDLQDPDNQLNLFSL
jgi:hypothetical protein